MASSRPHEVELKLEIGSAEAWRAWLGAGEIAGLQLRPAQPPTVQIADTYVDSADFHLLRRGYALRLRTQPPRAGSENGHSDSTGLGSAGLPSTEPPQAWMTVKSTAGALGKVSESGIHTRLEVEEPLEDAAVLAEPARWPAGVQAALECELPALRKLSPILHVAQTRHKRTVLAQAVSPGGEPPVLGELSLDEVELCGPAGEGTAARFCELELELRPGAAEEAAARATLEAVAAALAGAPGLAPAGASKLERGLRAVAARPAGAPADAAGIQPQMEMAEACRLIWRAQLMEVVLNEPGVRYSGEVEYVHKMRVALRRARAAGRLYGEHFKEKAIRGYMKRMRKTARLLGTVRDLDVLLINARRRRKQEDQPRADKRLVRQWTEQRKDAHKTLLAWLDSDAYAKFVASFARFCVTPGEGARRVTREPGRPPQPHQVRHVLPSLILNQFEAVRTYETLFEENGEVEYALIHRLRIDCKYLRYNVEFARHLLGPEGGAVIGRLRRLQDLLGELNDAVVAGQVLAAQEQAEPAYLEYNAAEVRRMTAAVPEALARFVERGNRQRLYAALAHI